MTSKDEALTYEELTALCRSLEQALEKYRKALKTIENHLSFKDTDVTIHIHLEAKKIFDLLLKEVLADD